MSEMKFALCALALVAGAYGVFSLICLIMWFCAKPLDEVSG